MAKLYQHQNERTYYTRVYRGAIATLQIHPAGVDYLFRQHTYVNDEISPEDIRFLDENDWLFTKDEVRGMGEVDWTYEGWKARQHQMSAPVSRASPSRSNQSQQTRREHVRRDNGQVQSFRTWCDRILVLLLSDADALANENVTMSLRRFQDLHQSLKSSSERDLRFMNPYYRSVVSLHATIRFLNLSQLDRLARLILEAEHLPVHSTGLDVQRHLRELKLAIEQQKRIISSQSEHVAILNPVLSESIPAITNEAPRSDDLGETRDRLQMSIRLQAQSSPPVDPAHVHPTEAKRFIERERSLKHEDSVVVASKILPAESPPVSGTSRFLRQWSKESRLLIWLGIAILVAALALIYLVG